MSFYDENARKIVTASLKTKKNDNGTRYYVGEALIPKGIEVHIIEIKFRSNSQVFTGKWKSTKLIKLK